MITFGPSQTSNAVRLRLYIPNKDKDAKVVPGIESWINKAQSTFVSMFGGCTIEPGNRGAWYCAERNIVIHEVTTIITAHVKSSDVLTHLAGLRRFIQELIYATNQETVAIEYQGTLHFVVRDPNAQPTQKTHRPAVEPRYEQPQLSTGYL